MSLLRRTNQDERAGQILEKQGDYQEAMTLYLKSSNFVKAATLLLRQNSLMSEESLVANILKNLLKHELYDPAAEIYERLGKHNLAMECYRKGRISSQPKIVPTTCYFREELGESR